VNPGVIDIVPSQADHELTHNQPGGEGWLQRVVAVVLDVSLLNGVAWLAVGDAGRAPTLWPGIQTSAEPSWALPIALAFLALLATQALTGWTPGKLVVGIAVVREIPGPRAGRPAGLLRTVGRTFAHVLDSLLFIGYLRPLWHRERRTFADSILRTVVVRRRPALPRTARLLLTIGALVLCIAGFGLSGSLVTGSWGGAVATGEASCLPAEPGPQGDDVARYASAEIRGTETRTEERRLWMTRTREHHFNYTARWTWQDGTLPSGDLAIRIEVAAPGGHPVLTEVAGIEGRSSEVTTVESEELPNGLRTAENSLGGPDVSGLGNGVAITTSLLRDGEPVATCTIPALTLEPTAWVR